MKKMIIAIAVLVALAFTTYLAFQTVDVKAASKQCLTIKVDCNGDVISIVSDNHDGDNLCILSHVVTECKNVTPPPPGCVWRRMDGYWKCVTP